MLARPNNRHFPSSETTCPTPGLLLIGHGTRDPAGLAEFHSLAAAVQTATLQPVESGFLELAKPTIGEAFDRLVAQGATHIRVCPLLLFAAGHARSDVPNAVHQAAARHPEVSVEISEPFGCDERLLALSQRRYDEAIACAAERRGSAFPCAGSVTDVGPTQENRPLVDPLTLPSPGGRGVAVGAWERECYLLLVGRGSSDTSATAEMNRFAELRSKQSSLDKFGVAFVAAAHPTLDEGLKEAVASDVRRIVVQPHLLFRGEVLGEVHSAVARWQSQRSDLDWVTTSHLGPEQELVQAILAQCPMTKSQ